MAQNTVFISYAREDSDKAKRLYDNLKHAGLNPWRDKESLLGGENWKMAIEKAVKEKPLFS